MVTRVVTRTCKDLRAPAFRTVLWELRCVLYKPLTQIYAVSNTLLRLTFLALVMVFFDMIKLTIISSLPVNTGLLVQYIIDARVHISIGVFI